jgi:hypothetical protein
VAIKVFPSANAVGGAAQKVLSEPNLGTWLGATTPRNYIANGLDLSGDGTATLTISPGAAIIAGRVVTVDEAVEIPVSGTGFYSCRLTLALDALGNVESAAAALVSTGTPATVNDLHLGHVYVSLGKVNYTDYSQGRYTSPHGTLYDSMVNRHVAFDTFFESIDGYQTSLTSSATATIDTAGGYLKLATSTTNGSSATISKYSFTDILSRERPNFAFEQWLSIEGRVDGVSLGASSEAWLVVGAPGVKRHIGFVSVNGQLFGTIGNGTTETRTEVLTEGTVTSLVAHHVPGQYVEFWAHPLGRAVLTTGLPNSSQSAAADRCIMYASIKTSNTTPKELRISSWHWRQLHN